MRLVLQRVKNASVSVNGRVTASINFGLLTFVGLAAGDEFPESWDKIRATLSKLPVLRIFPDEAGHMNKSLEDFGGDILLVSQFTLFAECRKGRRPSFHRACPPETAKPLYQKIVEETAGLFPGKVHTGIFAADMDIALTNWGPVTILLDSDDF